MLRFEIYSRLLYSCVYKKIQHGETAQFFIVLDIEFAKDWIVGIHIIGSEILKGNTCLQIHGLFEYIGRKVQGVPSHQLRHIKYIIALRNILIHYGIIERKAAQFKFFNVLNL